MEIRIFTNSTPRIIAWLYADNERRLTMVLGSFALITGLVAVLAVAWMLTETVGR